MSFFRNSRALSFIKTVANISIAMLFCTSSFAQKRVEAVIVEIEEIASGGYRLMLGFSQDEDLNGFFAEKDHVVELVSKSKGSIVGEGKIVEIQRHPDSRENDLIWAEFSRTALPPTMGTQVFILGSSFDTKSNPIVQSFENIWNTGNLDKIEGFLSSPRGRAAPNINELNQRFERAKAFRIEADRALRDRDLDRIDDLKKELRDNLKFYPTAWHNLFEAIEATIEEIGKELGVLVAGRELEEMPVHELQLLLKKIKKYNQEFKSEELQRVERDIEDMILTKREQVNLQARIERLILDKDWVGMERLRKQNPEFDEISDQDLKRDLRNFLLELDVFKELVEDLFNKSDQERVWASSFDEVLNSLGLTKTHLDRCDRCLKKGVYKTLSKEYMQINAKAFEIAFSTASKALNRGDTNRALGLIRQMKKYASASHSPEASSKKVTELEKRIYAGWQSNALTRLQKAMSDYDADKIQEVLDLIENADESFRLSISPDEIKKAKELWEWCAEKKDLDERLSFLNGTTRWNSLIQATRDYVRLLKRRDPFNEKRVYEANLSRYELNQKKEQEERERKAKRKTLAQPFDQFEIKIDQHVQDGGYFSKKKAKELIAWVDKYEQGISDELGTWDEMRLRIAQIKSTINSRIKSKSSTDRGRAAW